MSAQPVAPSFGIRSFTGAFAAWSVLVWYGHDAPIDRAAVLEQVDLVAGGRPVLLDQRALLLQQIDGRLELRLRSARTDP